MRATNDTLKITDGSAVFCKYRYVIAPNGGTFVNKTI